MLRKWSRVIACLMAALCLISQMPVARADFESQTQENPEDIVTAAMEVYSWFAMCPLDVDIYDQNEAGTLYRVFDDRLNTREQLEAVVRNWFSEEIAQSLLGAGVYTEENGYLYTGIEYREIDPTIAYVEYTIKEESETAVCYEATVFYSETEGEITSIEQYTFLREKIEENWLFTEFWFFW